MKQILLGSIGILVLCGTVFSIGYSAGSSSTQAEYQEKILEQLMKERALIQANRAKEKKWEDEAKKIELEHMERIKALEHSRDAVIARLRQQLDAYDSKLSSNSLTSSDSDAETRETNVSTRIKQLVDFSDRCARRTDELIVQVNSLQNWINKTNY